MDGDTGNALGRSKKFINEIVNEALFWLTSQYINCLNMTSLQLKQNSSLQQSVKDIFFYIIYNIIYNIVD